MDLRASPGGTPDLAQGRVIGLPVAIGDMPRMTEAIVDLGRRGRGGHVCVANVHMLTTARTDPDLRDTIETASLVVSDGAPLAWHLRRQGFAEAQQVRGPDLMLSVCRAATRERLPVYFYGGDARLLEDLVRELRTRIPGIVIAGAEAPPLLPPRPTLDPALVDRIRDSGARVVFVGLGCPKQELWMRAHRPQLDAVLIGVGQAFAIAAGHLEQAPRWMRRAGLEWLYRLASEPRRLWRRYLVTNSLFAGYVARDLLASAFHGRRITTS